MENKAKIYQQGMTPQEARSKLDNLLGENRVLLMTSADGHEARLNSKSVKKMLSQTAIRKSVDNGFTARQHYAVVSDIEDVYRNSKTVLTRPDRHGQSDVTIHRMVTPLYFDDSAAYITVKETIQGGNRIHSLELIEIGRLGRALKTDGQPTAQPLPPSLPKGDDVFQASQKSDGNGQNARNNLGAAVTINTKIIHSETKVNSKSEKNKKNY